MNSVERQNARRRGLPRLPTGYLNYGEYVLLQRAAQKYGSKKAALVEGLKRLEGEL